ncbi:MAG: hypothetical protein E3J73_01455 [Candidatus Bathyarchaeum sp.]|nr:MAG: hypothetical protein E3J73_01455 [Candidatus Bathyarchaeum sp.]
MGTSSSNLAFQSDVVYNPSSQVVKAGSILNVTLTDGWNEGTRYYFIVGTEEGLSIPFSRECPIYGIGFMQTKEVAITEMNFLGTITADKNITIAVTNTGTSAVTISIIKVNGATISTVTGDTTLDAGASGTIVITSAWTAGNKYSVNFFATDGTLIGSYTATA